MTGRLAGKIALVTGAGSGIGAAIAACFVREGATVIIAEKDPVTGSAMAARLEAGGGRALFIETDVSDCRAADTAITQTLAVYGRLDILVNNAGINVFHEPLETSDAEWRR